MAISVVGATTGAANATSFNISKHASAVTGDLAIVGANARGDNQTFALATALIRHLNGGTTTNDVRANAWYRDVLTADTSYTIAISGGVVERAGGVALFLRDHDTTSPINAENGDIGDLIAPAVTPTVDDCLLVCIWVATGNGDPAGFAPPGTMVERAEASQLNCAVMVATQQLSGGAGVSTGTRTATGASGADEVGAFTIAIAPAVVSSVPPPRLTIVGQSVSRASVF